jgi:holin-like protein
LITGASIILLSLFAGNLISSSLGLPIPGNIIGMTLLLLLLICGIVKVKWIKGVADFLISNLALFFVPVGAGMIAHFGLIGSQFIPITAAFVLSTFIVMGVTGLTAQKMLKGDAADDADDNR